MEEIGMKRQSILAIIDALEAAHVKYLVVGGLAVVAHGFVRYTMDLDLVVSLEPANATAAIQALTDLAYRPRVPVRATDFADAPTRETWVREKEMVVFQMTSDLHPETPVDLFVTIPFDFEAQHQRATILPLIGARKVPVIALDELLAMKQKVARSKDLLDVAELRKIHRLPSTP